jgi:hypothetical protein
VPASVLYMSMSLDGYIAGPNDEPGNPGGDGFDRLHEWITARTAGRTPRPEVDFASALARDPYAQEAFDRLSYSRRQWFVVGIEGAKKPETRQRRIAKAVVTLRAAA